MGSESSTGEFSLSYWTVKKALGRSLLFICWSLRNMHIQVDFQTLRTNGNRNCRHWDSRVGGPVFFPCLHKNWRPYLGVFHVVAPWEMKCMVLLSFLQVNQIKWLKIRCWPRIIPLFSNDLLWFLPLVLF